MPAFAAAERLLHSFSAVLAALESREVLDGCRGDVPSSLAREDADAAKIMSADARSPAYHRLPKAVRFLRARLRIVAMSSRALN
jgi:hypothetical protein